LVLVLPPLALCLTWWTSHAAAGWKQPPGLLPVRAPVDLPVPRREAAPEAEPVPANLDDVLGRAIAAATHPDRRDGGDVARYTAATAAYAVLRTPWGRSEAFADLALAVDDTSPLPAVEAVDGDAPVASTGGSRASRPGDLLAAVLQLPTRIRHGRPLRLVIRALAAALLSLAVLNLIPGQPAAPALVTGLITWFLLTGRADLAPPR
jgi:hypothetical protein